MIIFQLYILVFILALASQNGTSFLLMSKAPADALKYKRLDRWHKENVLLNFLAIVPFLISDPGRIPSYLGLSLLWRIAVVDVAFNYFAKLKLGYIGTTAKIDKLTAKVFGINGAVTKMIFFVALIVLLNILLLSL